MNAESPKEMPALTKEEFIKQKQEAINAELVNMKLGVMRIMATLPKAKNKRNIFKRKVNRRPRIKQKRALAAAQVQIMTRMTLLQISMIRSQPIPKYKPGSMGNVVTKDMVLSGQLDFRSTAVIDDKMRDELEMMRQMFSKR